MSNTKRTNEPRPSTWLLLWPGTTLLRAAHKKFDQAGQLGAEIYDAMQTFDAPFKLENHSLLATPLNGWFGISVDSRRLAVKNLRVTPPEETKLLARCRRGEAAAWGDLFDLHYAAAARFIFQLGADFTREDAEEIAQETFLAAIQHLGSFHGESRFQTWLFRIAANKARDFREKRQAAKRGGGVTALSLDAEDSETGLKLDAPSHAPAPDIALANAEQFAQMRRAVERLEAPCREVVELRYFGDLSYEEIGSALKLNVKTVSSRLSKCLDKLEEIAKKIFAGDNAEISRPTS